MSQKNSANAKKSDHRAALARHRHGREVPQDPGRTERNGQCASNASSPVTGLASIRALANRNGRPTHMHNVPI